MVPNLRIILGLGLNSCDRDLDLIDSFLSWSEVTRNIKDLIGVELLFAGFEMDLIYVFLWDFDDVLDLGFGEVLDLDLFGCVYASKRGGKVDFPLVLNLDIGLCTSTNKSHLSIRSRHIIQMHINSRRISLILCRCELNRNNSKTLGLDQPNFGVELKGLINIMSHSEVDGGVGLVGQFETVVHRGV